MCHPGRMAQDVCPVISGEDRARLEAIIADRNRAHKHVLRARIVCHAAARLSVAEVARWVGVGRSAVWRWQRRFAEAGVNRLLRDASLKPSKAPLRAVPAGQVIHVILDDYAAHKHPKVLGLARPAPALDLALHADLRLLAQRGRDLLFSAHPPAAQARHFRSIVELQAAINRYLAEHNRDPKPFAWTKRSDQILAKANRLNASEH
jgi:Homeodomain-like domain